MSQPGRAREKKHKIMERCSRLSGIRVLKMINVPFPKGYDLHGEALQPVVEAETAQPLLFYL